MIQPTIKFDTAAFEAGIVDFARAFKKDLRLALFEQAKLFIRDLISFTPPHGKSPTKEGTTRQRKIGEAAIQRDVGRVFIAAEDIDFKSSTKESKRLQKYLRRYAKEGRLGAAKKVLEVLGFRNEVTTVARPHIHKRARGRKGRVSKRITPTIVLNRKSLRDYLKQVKKHAGKAKAGFARAAKALGVPVPSWVDAHSTPGVFDNQLARQDRPYIEMGNLISYASDFDPLKFQAAIDNRARAIPLRIKAVMEATAKKKGIKTSGGT